MARTLIIAACLCGFLQAQNSPAPQPQKQSVRSEQNPFEAVPPAPPQHAVGPGVIEGIDFRGSRQTPQDALRETIFSKVGDAYNEEAARRDVLILRSRFEDVRVSTEQGEKGGVILHFVVTDRLPAQ